jgi:hypothetical protein
VHDSGAGNMGVRRIELQEEEDNSSSSSSSSLSSSSSSSSSRNYSDSSNSSSSSSSSSSTSSSSSSSEDLFTIYGYLNVNVNGSTNKTYYIPLYSKGGQRVFTSSNIIFYGDVRFDSVSHYGFLSMLINGSTEYLEIYTGPAGSGVCSNLIGTLDTNIDYDLLHYAYINNQGLFKWTPAYSNNDSSSSSSSSYIKNWSSSSSSSSMLLIRSSGFNTLGVNVDWYPDGTENGYTKFSIVGQTGGTTRTFKLVVDNSFYKIYNRADGVSPWVIWYVQGYQTYTYTGQYIVCPPFVVQCADEGTISILN